MTPPREQQANRFLLYAVILVGVSLRLVLPFFGYNYDVRSYRIVADIMQHGGNVYAETIRYNYSPVWFNLLHLFDLMPWHPPDPIGIRWKIVILLTLGDLGIFAFLLRHYSLRVAALFFLNPISILITGYHNQFDNLAVLAGLVAVYVYEKGSVRPHRILGAIGLGVSLCIKHILFLFPLWLAIKEKRWPMRILVVVVPYAIFLASFLPYWSEGAAGIRHNVFQYKSWENAPFWSMVLPFRHLPISKRNLFFAALLLLGVLWRKKPPLASIHYYFLSLVAFSSAITNQYLAICTPSIAVLWNWAFAVYTLAGSVMLIGDNEGLQVALPWHVAAIHKYDIAIAFLVFGLLIAVMRRKSAEPAA